MKKLQTLTPAHAFVHTMISGIVYLLNAQQDEAPLLPAPVKSAIARWSAGGAAFAAQYGIPKTAYAKYLNLLTRDDTDSLEEAAFTVADAVRTKWARIEKDTTIELPMLNVIKDVCLWHRNESPAALARLRKNMGKIGVSSDLMTCFREEVEDQARFVAEARKLVKKIAGVDAAEVPLEIVTEVREKTDPEVWKKYNALRRSINGVAKTAIMNYVRESGKKFVPIKEMLTALKKQGIVDHKVPRSFDGQIDENGDLYTKAGRKIDGRPQYDVTMNPRYRDATDDTSVFTTKLPNGTVQYYATVEYNQRRAAKKFSIARELASNITKYRSKWLRDLKSTKPEVAIPACIVELGYESCIRIGTPGNATKGVATQGLTTLLVGNVKRQGANRILDFLAKDAVATKYVIRPDTVERRLLIKWIDALCEDKTRKDKLFEHDGKWYNAAKIRTYFRTVTGMPDVKIHTIRHLQGTRVAMEVLDELGAELDKARTLTQTIVNKKFMEAMQKVGKLLGHVRGVGATQKTTGATAIKSYVDPELMREFFQRYSARGIRIPSVVLQAMKENK